jgi:hypothetical protein
MAHPIFSNKFYKWWLILAALTFVSSLILGLPKLSGYEQYDNLFWTISLLLCGLIFGSIIYLLYRIISGNWNDNVFMICISITLLIIILNIKRSNQNYLLDFEKSFKEQQGQNFNQHLDSATNVYANFKYHVAFDGPDNWKSDMGVSAHTIFRTFQPDSLLTFSINVIEKNIKDEDKEIDIWDMYQENKPLMDDGIKTLYEKQLKSKLKDYTYERSFIKNNSCLKFKFNYDIKNLDLEYNLTFIV